MLASEFPAGARADRIERLADGRYAIVDYKTGRPPTEKQVRTGFAPQLTLEGAILRQRGLPGYSAGASVGELLYVQIARRRAGGRAVTNCISRTSTPDDEADTRAGAAHGDCRAFRGLQETPYRSLVHPMWRPPYGDYDHLARVKEWSACGGEEFGE